MKNVLIWLAVLVVVIGLGWVLTANDLAMRSVFAPKQEAVRREVFEQSKAYNQGMVQELQNMQFAYIKAGAEERVALRPIILHRAADYPADKMPYDLRNFIQTLKDSQ